LVDDNPRSDASLSGYGVGNYHPPPTKERNMRKVLIALVLSAAFIVSGISATTFSTGQFTGIASADGGE
jgi:hypothetical protein